MSFPSLALLPIGLVVIGARSHHALLGIGVVAVGVGLGAIGFRWPAGRRVPFVFAVPAFAIASAAAAIQAWSQALQGRKSAIWEPTRRPTAHA
jgi:hypothetical protein